jgi:Zn-dependent protease with chaperone function
MKPGNRHFVSFQRVIAGVLLLLPLISCQGWAKPASPKPAGSTDTGAAAREPRTVELSLDLYSDRTADVMLEIDSSLKRKYNFPQVLSSALDCQLRAIDLTRDNERSTSILNAECAIPFDRSRFARAGSINLRPINTILNFESKRDFILMISVPQHDFVRCDPVPTEFHQAANSARCMYFFSSSGRVPESIYFQSGYSRGHVLRMTGILGFLLLLPVAATFWFRRRSRLSSAETRPAIWFAYRRFLTWTALFGALLWWATLDLLRAPEFAGFLLPGSKWTDDFAFVAIPWILLWLPPACIYLLCLALSAPMQSMRGTHYSQKQILNRSFWAVARFALPLPLLAFGIMELFNSPRLGVLLLIAAFIAGRFTTRRFVRAYGLELHALSSGELRDRAFALAEKAGTKLNQLFVLPAEGIRMANAFAHAAHNIYLTDYLLKNLNRAEVDAVVAHEIAHLEKKHIGWRTVLTILLIAGYACSAILLERWVPPSFPNGPIFYGLFLLIFFFLSRRNEFVADAGSVKLTGNAEAMITALVRISRLNTMPLHWGKLDEKVLTHPSTLRRIRRLASEAGIDEARISELLSNSSAPPAEGYAIPRTALPAGKIFSSRYKAQLAGKLAWRIMLTAAVLPAGVAIAAHWGQLEGEKLLLAYSLGLFVTLAADLALLNFLPMRGLKKMEQLLRLKLRSESTGGIDIHSLFVGLAPDSGPRIYEGNWAWDLGFIILTPELLSYQGEESGFSLARGDISSIYLGPGPTGWFTTPSVYIAWRETAGHEAVFNLRPLGAKSMVEMAVKTRQLADDLQNWQARRPPASNPVLVSAASAGQNLGIPKFAQVTSTPPRALVRGQYLVRDFFLNTLLAIGTMVLFGLGFPLVDDLFRSSDSPNLNSSYGGLYVLLVVWLARLFVLLPFWRTSGNPTGNEAATRAPQASQ